MIGTDTGSLISVNLHTETSKKLHTDLDKKLLSFKYFTKNELFLIIDLERFFLFLKSLLIYLEIYIVGKKILKKQIKFYVIKV